MKFRVCIKCTPPHVENCPQCFGYGFQENGTPIAAGEAGENWPDNKPYTPCPACGGTPYNQHLIDMAIKIREDAILNGDPKEPPVGLLGNL